MFLGALNPTAEIVDRSNSWFRALWPNHGRIGDPKALVIWHSADLGLLPAHQLLTDDLVVAIDGYVWRGDEISADASEARRTLDRLGGEVVSDGGWPLPSSWDGSYSCAAHDRRRRVLALGVDPVGLRRLFHGRSGRTLVFGTTQAACAFALGLEPDLCGVAQWLASCYILGRRTLFTGLHEILPGERARFSAEGEPIDSLIERPWHRNVRRLSAESAARELEPLLRRQAERYAASGGSAIGLALSAGLDSRLVLGALGNRARGMHTYTYGDPGEYEVRLARRCAEVVGATWRVGDAVGRFFPSEDTLRRQALLAEAAAYPFWLPTGEQAFGDGVTSLLMGDITNCLQVRIKPLWGRRERVALRLASLLGRRPRLADGPAAAEDWWRATEARHARDAAYLAGRLGLDVTTEEIERGVAHDLTEVASMLGSLSETPLYQLLERFYLATEREFGGSQALVLNGQVEIIPAFATRGVMTAALDVELETRAWRRLLDALARRLLDKPLRRVPTPTIPLVGVTSPKLLQEAVWLIRWSCDAALQKLVRKTRGLTRRERLFATFRLQPEYERAAADFYGQPWAVSGIFSSDYYSGRVHRTARWIKPPVMPNNELRAICADTILAAARRGPSVLKNFSQLERR
ncbi:MAG: hypothetical protein GY719_10890 [bacterium]|nr:hypothetical protein [bacterium]